MDFETDEKAIVGSDIEGLSNINDDNFDFFRLSNISF